MESYGTMNQILILLSASAKVMEEVSHPGIVGVGGRWHAEPGEMSNEEFRVPTGAAIRNSTFALRIAYLAFGAGEFAEKIFIDAPEDVIAVALRVTEADGGAEVNDAAEALLVEARAGVILQAQGRAVGRRTLGGGNSRHWTILSEDKSCDKQSLASGAAKVLRAQNHRGKLPEPGGESRWKPMGDGAERP